MKIHETHDMEMRLAITSGDTVMDPPQTAAASHLSFALQWRTLPTIWPHCPPASICCFNMYKYTYIYGIL